MCQDKLERMTPPMTELEPQDSLKAEVAGDIRRHVANTLENNESVSRMLGNAALRSHVIETLTTRAHGK